MYFEKTMFLCSDKKQIGFASHELEVQMVKLSLCSLFFSSTNLRSKSDFFFLFSFREVVEIDISFVPSLSSNILPTFTWINTSQLALRTMLIRSLFAGTRISLDNWIIDGLTSWRNFANWLTSWMNNWLTN